MHPKSPSRLWTVQDATGALIEFGKRGRCETPLDAQMHHLAFERELMIAGRAAQRLVDDDPDLARTLPGIQEVIEASSRIDIGRASITSDSELDDLARPIAGLNHAVSRLLEAIGPPGAAALTDPDQPLEPPPPPRLHPAVAQHLDALIRLCEAYGVSQLDVFGSAITDAFDPDRSDVDFLVEYAPDFDFGRSFDLDRDVEALLGRSVQLISRQALRNPYFIHSVDTTKLRLYPN